MEKEQVVTILAENLRKFMNQRGMTNMALAKRCNVSNGTISKITNGLMSITIPMAVNLANGLDISLYDLLAGLAENHEQYKKRKPILDQAESMTIGILSIHNKRITCIKDHTGKIIGTSELATGLDLTETAGKLLKLIKESIDLALAKQTQYDYKQQKNAKINLIMQSYEFENTRHRFILFAKKHFKSVMLLPDWELTYLAAFNNTPGISLIVDKGVSLSYLQHDQLKKLGGWKFPLYDLGGENWLGVQTIRHTIEAVEGYIPMSELASMVLAKFNGKIERVVEVCFKGTKDADVYCLFTELLLRCYFAHDPAAKAIITKGCHAIKRLINRADEIIGKKLAISLTGSLTDIYTPFLDADRLLVSSSHAEKVALLASLSPEQLLDHV